MKTTIAIALITLIVSNSSDAQTPNESWFDYDGQANGPAWIFQTDYGYITFSGLADIETLSKGCLITGLNENGEALWHKPLWSEEGSWPMNFGGAVIQASDSGFYLLLNKRINEELRYPVILRVNDEGDTLWSKPLLVDEPGSYAGFSIAQSPQGDLFMAGYVDLDPDPFEYNHKFTIMKADSEANYQWHLNTTVGNYPVPISILATEEDVLVGGRLWDGLTDQSYGITKDFIRKFDYDGTPQWLKKIHVPPAGAEAGVYTLLQLENGNYLYGTGRSEGTLSGNGETSNNSTQITIGELNEETGDTILELGFQDHMFPQQIFKLVKTSDGGFIAVGQHIDGDNGPSEGWPIGYMLKLDENLNEHWYRYYVPSVWEGMGRWNNLTDVVENDNGTYTAVGLIYTNTGDGPQNGFIQDTYILTVDSLGCLVEGCDVGISEFEYSGGLSVYPNPASESVTIQFPSRHNWTIRISNAQGLFVFEEKKIQSLHTTVSVESLPSGIYFLHCINQQGKIFVEQLIKN